ncbi:MAG: hypothetical protein BLM47_13995, partial [Candidatus Reconcilbacillus cellulovorans]
MHCVFFDRVIVESEFTIEEGHLMNRSLIKIGTAALAVALAAPLGVWPSGVFPAGERQTASAASARQMEFLNRGLVAVKVSNGVFLSWRLLGT